MVDKLLVCRNCLYSHQGKSCYSTKKCKECNQPHHTILHDACNNHVATSGSYTRPSLTSLGQQNVNHAANQNDDVLLPTALLRVKSNDGSYIVLRALIDQGSQICLLKESNAQRLGLQRRRVSGTIMGVGITSKRSKGVLELQCKSCHSDYEFTKEVHVMTEVLNSLPNSTFSKPSWPHIQGIQLADPKFNIKSSVDMLLDASVYSKIVLNEIMRGPSNLPIAQNTKIGWIVFGEHAKQYNCYAVINNIEEISQFWEMEEIADSSASTMTSEEEYCEELYKASTIRLPDGKYMVKIPMKPNYEQHLGESKSQAIAQFLQLEKRMLKDEFMNINYNNKKFIQQYLFLNYMKPSNFPNVTGCYLPHHGVLKPESSTTKLRVVFNASAKTKGFSLRKWTNNAPNLLETLLQDQVSENMVTHNQTNR